MRVIPIGQYVVVKRTEAEQATPGGIFLPDAARQRPRQGLVLSVGDGRQMPDGERAQHQVTDGDRVLFAPYAGTEVEIDGQELIIIAEDEILAIVE